MTGNYNEQNNHTGYPLSGGVKPTVTPEFAEKYEKLKADYDALIINFSDAQHLLNLEKTKNELLEKQKEELLKLLTLSIGGVYLSEPLNPRFAQNADLTQAKSAQNPNVLSGLMQPKQ